MFYVFQWTCNVQLHVMSLLFPRALCSPHQTRLRCNTTNVERSLSLHSTFQAHWSVRRRVTVFCACRSLAGGATTLPLAAWGLCFLLLRALIGNIDHMYFFIILGHVRKWHVGNKTLARSRKTVAKWYTLITRFNSSTTTCSNMNIVQAQTLILTNKIMACCKLNLACLIMVAHIELSCAFPTVTPHWRRRWRCQRRRRPMLLMVWALAVWIIA
jgi:hypothetical protein